MRLLPRYSHCVSECDPSHTYYRDCLPRRGFVWALRLPSIRCKPGERPLANDVTHHSPNLMWTCQRWSAGKLLATPQQLAKDFLQHGIPLRRTFLDNRSNIVVQAH